MNANSLCLEEYVDLLKTSYNYSSEHLKITDAKGVKYEVYYIPKTGTNTTIYIPASSGGYEISGDNVGGYIVTVTLN
jgi:D-alanyl-D-alanine carboxypeptidase